MTKQELKDLFSASLDLEMALFKLKLASEEMEDRDALQSISKWSQLISQVKNDMEDKLDD